LDNSSDKRNFLEVPLVNQLFNKFQTLRKIASKHTQQRLVQSIVS